MDPQSKRATSTAWLAFAWGFAEATVFFIVPDVLLTRIALRRARAALFAALLATAGAMLGGIVMYVAGQRAPQAAFALLDHVPGIEGALIADVGTDVEAHGHVALFRGLFRGWPYKVYAVENGARSSGLALFLLFTALARTGRFFVSVLIARAVTFSIARWTRHRPRIEICAWAVFWLGFYAFYFAAFGW